MIEARWRLNPVTHEICECLRFVGLRDRLRCPDCRSVGTWKPHGGWYDRRHGDVRAVRRWMCKYCGLYLGPEGLLRVAPNATKGYWDFVSNIENPAEALTPKDLLSKVKLWPWAG